MNRRDLIGRLLAGGAVASPAVNPAATCNAMAVYLADPYRDGESVYESRGIAMIGADS